MRRERESGVRAGRERKCVWREIGRDCVCVGGGGVESGTKACVGQERECVCAVRMGQMRVYVG